MSEASSAPFPGVDLDVPLEEVRYPCYSVKVLQKTNEIEIRRNKKVLKKLSVDDFPPHLGIDFNNPEHLVEIIKVVKEQGAVGLISHFQIR